jgi:lycopene beta-cyclase
LWHRLLRLPAGRRNHFNVPVFNQLLQFLNSTAQYDFIICGAGCAGLSLLMHMIESGKFSDKKILLIDKEKKNKNDRTWCFWETQPGLFDQIVCKKWNKTWFHGEGFSDCLDISPYEYKMIRGIDLYQFSFDLIQLQRNIDILFGEVQKLESNREETSVIVDGKKFTAGAVFNSIVFKKPELKKDEYYLLQHFKGWIIESALPVFDPVTATLMDFRIGQQQGTSFVYVMPFSETKALVEYTLFTHALLQPQQYDEGLNDYISRFLRIVDYKITDEEFGIIPMTNQRFPAFENNIINIGTAGGQTKASSGYTFRFIQKNSAAIVRQLLHSGNPVIKRGPRRFHFYDSVLLDILHHNSLPGKEIFTDLFKKNKPQAVLRFLDNETTLMEELKIISTLPTLPFLKASLKHL